MNYRVNTIDELYHHGVLGQRWGVRRYQNKDGSLTAAGEKRYSDDSSKNFIDQHKQKLIDKYVQKGYSQSAASTMATQRMKTEAVLLVVGTIAVGIAAKKVATRVGEDYCDRIIKSGQEIQNIGADKNATFKDRAFYAAVNATDKEAYGNLYPNEKRAMAKASMGLSYDGIYKNKIKVMKDVKVPSVNNARKILNEKLQKDNKFRSEVLDAIKTTAYGKNAEELLKKNPKKFYDRFNQALATPEFQSKGIPNKFYSELEKHGYNALLDINDSRYSGYKGIAKSPTIFFGKNIVEKIGNTKLTDAEINKNYMEYIMQLQSVENAKSYAKLGAGLAVAKSVSDDIVVKTYLDQHPNSKLSKKEILKWYKNTK